MISIETLKTELASVQQQITQTAANLNALAGAEQMLQKLITQADANEQASEPAQPPSE